MASPESFPFQNFEYIKPETEADRLEKQDLAESLYVKIRDLGELGLLPNPESYRAPVWLPKEMLIKANKEFEEVCEQSKSVNRPEEETERIQRRVMYLLGAYFS